MSENNVTEKEYEALAVIRDIVILLYSEISENLGKDSIYLSKAYEQINLLTLEAEKEILH